MNIALRTGEIVEKSFEYFCKNCLQLRLSLVMCDTCGNCGSDQIIKGDLETLDKKKLINEYKS